MLLISLVRISLFSVITFLFTFVLMQSEAYGAQTQTIQLLAGLSKPPFVIAQTKQGMQIEIVEAAFSVNNYQVNFMHLPLSLHMGIYKRRRIDGLITLSDSDIKINSEAKINSDTELGLYLSKPYINYQNVVITLAKNNLHISKLSELSGKRIAAFQNSAIFLNSEYNNVVKDSNSYVELADQKSQLALLFTERVDAIVMDVNIFKYILLDLQKSEKSKSIYTEKVNIHPLFEIKSYCAGFKSKQLQELFDEGIMEIKATGQYQAIIDRYLSPKKI